MTHALSRIASFLRPRFRREITFALVLKLFALWLLWYLFFSHPTSKELNTHKLSEHYLATSYTKST